MTIRLITAAATRREFAEIAEKQFGNFVKVVVDIERGIMAIGGELHADEEAALIDQDSKQEHLWGINVYPARTGDDWIEFDSMINIRPSQRNFSRDVEDPKIQRRIRDVIAKLITA
ncbi:MAG: DUF5674 family protein [Patescibacteria group bacterium]